MDQWKAKIYWETIKKKESDASFSLVVRGFFTQHQYYDENQR